MPGKPVLYPPEVEAPWPPPWNAGAREVTLDDHWQKIANAIGIPAMDLIEFNFRTRIPETINWYLHYKVGCTLPTDDGKNYRFGRKPEDPPKRLFIYIPPKGWTPYTSDDDDEKARTLVIRTLLSGTAAKIHFNLDGVRVWPGDMATVAGYVLQGKIYVRYDSSNPNRARYRPNAIGTVPANRMMLGFTSNNQNHRALICHEATHAISDIRRASMTRIQTEAVGYTAQALWHFHEGSLTPPTNFGGAEVASAAFAVAAYFYTGAEPDYAAVIDLYAAIARTSDGTRSAPIYDGL
jgi:hypothetical protein